MWLAKLTACQQRIKEKPTLTIKALRGEYNISKPGDLKNLTGRINAYAKTMKKDTLINIQKQTDDLLKPHKDSKPLKEIKKLLTDRLAKLNKKDNYKPYTELLEDEFTLDERAKSSTQRTGKTQANAVLKYKRDGKMEAYLAKSVSEKKKRGQDNVEEITACFWFDFLKNTDGFFAEDNDRACIILYLVTLKNFYSHNASYYPAQGHGKSSQTECEHPLFYVRSQTKHHELAEYKKETGESNSLGSQNAAYLRMVQHCGALNQAYRDKTKQVNQRGTRGAALKDEAYYGEKIAHLGSRANNVVHSRTMMEAAYDGSSKDNYAELSRLLGQPGKSAAYNKTTTEYNKKTTAENIQSARNAFVELKTKLQPGVYANAASALMRHRAKQAKHIVSRCKKLDEFVQVSSPTDSPLIYIDLYPGAFASTRDSKNVKEGLTNLLLGFFGGLLNHMAKERGMHYFVQRRQSFGFLRPTLTDAGSLRMRLSLGANPEPFNQLVIDTIKALNKLLKTFNFSEPEKSIFKKRQTLVSNTQKVCEEKMGTQKTEKTGNYCLNAMRTEDDQWVALLAAQKYLSKAGIKPETAFEEYLQKFIIDRADHKKISENDNKNILRTGYSVENAHSVDLDEEAEDEKDADESIKSNPLFILLNNLINTTVNYVTSLGNIPTSSSAYYVLIKLLHNCEKGQAVLTHAHQYNLSHLQTKATLLIENIQEYLILLRCLAKDNDNATDDLKELEQLRFAETLGLTAEDCHVFYNDGGQQAINTAIMAMTFEGMKSFYLFDGSYYETPEFFHDSGLKKASKVQSAVWFCDITHLDKPKTALDKKPGALKALIIDITHNSSAEKLQELAGTIAQAKEKGLWVTLSCSTLKHEQLGQDKYQSGRNIIIPPTGKSLNSKTTQKYLDNISQEAMNPLTASFRQTVETVMHEASGKALGMHGMFKYQDKDALAQTPLLAPNI